MAAPPAPARRALGITLIVFGAISGIAVLGASLAAAFTSVVRFDSGGGASLRLEPGDYTVYLETAGAFPMNAESASGSISLLVWGAGGVDLPVHGARTWAGRYSTGRRAGVAIASFTADREDEYYLGAARRPDVPLPRGELSVTRSVGAGALAWTVLVPLALLGTGVGLGISVLLRRPRTAGAAATPPRP